MFAFDEPFGSCIFCDDIRQEIGGKTSYMGVYLGSVFVPTFPVTLPKFCIAVVLNEPREMALTRDWSIPVKVFLPGQKEDEPSVTIELPPVSKETFNVPTEVSDDKDVPKLMLANIIFGIAPLVLPQPGRMKVRAYYKSDVIRLGSIKVERPPGAVTSPNVA